MKTEKPATSRNTYINSCSRIVIIAVLTVAMLVTVASAQAVAAPTWLDPESLSEADGSPVDQAQIGLDAAGNALAIWWAEEGDRQLVKYTERMVGGEWSAPGYLTVGGELGEDARDLQLAVDAEGNAVALWRHKIDDKWRIVEINRDVGGEWSSTRELSQEEHNAASPQVAISGGNMAAMWKTPLLLPTYTSAVLARVRAAGEAWGNDQVLSEVNGAPLSQQIAVNDSGNAIAAWSRFNFPDNKTNIRASYYSPDSGWSQPSVDLLPVSVSQASAPDVTIDQVGNAMVVWREFDDGDGSWHIRSAYRPADADPADPDGGWSDPVDIFGGAQGVDDPKVEVDSKGNAVAVWSPDDATSRYIYSVDRPNGGSWDEPTIVATFDEGAVNPRSQLAVNATGDATVVWVGQDDSGSGYGIYSATRSAGSDPGGERDGWTEPVVVDGGMSSDPGTAGIAIDGEGNSVATWADNTSAPVIRAAAYDFAEPRIVGMNIPATGTVGVPINFSASSTNTWGITSTSWSFGDGRQATGQSVTHTYALPGTYRVQATAADLVGSNSSATRTITISQSAQESKSEPGSDSSSKPKFKVKVSNDGRGKRTSVELGLSTQDRYIKKVRFGLPRYLKLSTKRLGKKKHFGSLKLVTKTGELGSSLTLSQSVRAKRKGKKAIRFGINGALNDLKVSLFKRKVDTKTVKVRTKSGERKTVKLSVLKSRMSFKSLPKQDIKGLTVQLNPSESRFLRNPKGCKNPLKFLAFVTTSDGKRHILSQKVKLKGKGCGKKKKSKSTG